MWIHFPTLLAPLHPVALAQLAPSPNLDLSVHLYLLSLNNVLGLAASAHSTAPLQELIKLDVGLIHAGFLLGPF
jgi:hypothetical protein